MQRGEIWWANFGPPYGSEPGFRRPVLIVQADEFNATRLGTLVVIALTTSERLAGLPGNVHLPAGTGGLLQASVVNVTQVAAVDRGRMVARIGRLPPEWMASVEKGLRRILGL